MPNPVLIPVHAIKGRGTATHIAHRFSVDERAAFDDGWGTLEDGAAESAEKLPLQTQVTFEDCKSAITHNDSPHSPLGSGMQHQAQGRCAVRNPHPLRVGGKL